MTNLKPTSEPSVADSAELLAETSAEAGRKPRAGWRMLLPTMTPWLAIGLGLIVLTVYTRRLGGLRPRKRRAALAAGTS